MSIFCATTSFQILNSVDMWIGSFLMQDVHIALRTLQIQWSSCWSDISEKLELSAVISLQSGRPDHLIFIRVTFGCEAIWKMFCSTPIAHFAELKVCIAQRILNMTSMKLWSIVEHAISRFQFLAENGKQHIEHVLHPVSQYLKNNLMDAFY